MKKILERNALKIVFLLAWCMIPTAHGEVHDGSSGARRLLRLIDSASDEGPKVYKGRETLTYRQSITGAADTERHSALHDFSVKTTGDYVPPLQIGVWIKGGPFTLGDGTIYVVEFWATWCPHCANAVSYLTDIQHTYGPRGVQVVAISWEAVDTVRNYVEARGDAMDYAVAVDNYSATFLVYDAIYDITGVPHVFLVDGEGRFVWRGHPVDPALIQQLEAMTLSEGEEEIEGESEGEGEGESEGEEEGEEEGEGDGEGEIQEEIHPADMNADWRVVMSEAIAYLRGWQQANNPMNYAIQAAYIWQNGEAYICYAGQEPLMCLVLEEGEVEVQEQGF